MKKWAKFGVTLLAAISLGATIVDANISTDPQVVQAATKKYTMKHLKKLKLGMTKKKVKKLIGAPDNKYTDSWSYLSYSAKTPAGIVEFKKGKVSGGSIGTLSKQAEKKATKAKAKKVAPINAAIDKSLKEDQGFAAGTLDAIGKPTTNGTPNTNFEWSTYVISITVEKSGDSYRVDGQVNAKVAALTDDAKAELGTHIQNLALSTLAELNKASDDDLTNGLFTDVKSGKIAIVQSHITNNKEFRVY